MKRLAILGSTGSIGQSALAVVDAHPDKLCVVALAAGNNAERMAEQIARYRPEAVAMGTGAALDRVRALGAPLPATAGTGAEGLIAVATHPGADIVLCASAGTAGLEAVLAAIAAGKRIALANKEVLVMAGALVTAAARAHGVDILPVDSEHNAIHQCLHGRGRAEIKRLILTASGGPFRAHAPDALEHVSPDAALRHPTWSMGAKITIDSATLMNKGLEVIEAHWLFGFEADQIDIVVHPESVVHSMVELIDGSVIAQMGVTDMRHAIQYALTYPERHPCELPPLDLTALSTLHFEAPDLDRFPCIALAYRALRAGGTLPAAMNAANEEAVRAFIDERICLTDIPRVIQSVMDQHAIQPVTELDVVLNTDRAARLSAITEIEKLAGNADVTARRAV